MPSKKQQEIAKHLLRGTFKMGMDFSVYKWNLVDGSVGTKEFDEWFDKLVKLNKCFIQYKTIATTQNYASLLAHVTECGYSQSWIDAIIAQMGIVPVIEDNSLKEEEERKRREAEAERKRKEEERKRREAEAEAERKRKEEAERKRREAEAEAERKRKEEEAEAERKRKEEAERKRREAEAEEKHKHLESEEKKSVKFCRKCGKSISTDSKFCVYCGAVQKLKKCRNCKKVISESAVFCPYCNTFI
jgi:RNA polymerase subunit RPABC4/transcription elongation factor Spt4